jgi:methionyl-tRNA formyltransferase
MNVFIFGNNRVCLEIIKFLNDNKEVNIVGICLLEHKRQKFAKEIKSELPITTRVIEFKSLTEQELVAIISALECDIAFSVYFGYILSTNLIDLFPRGIVNLHPAYLPYNRGSAPNVFSIIDDTPAGITMHYIDEGIDTGGIIAQEIVPKESIDTGKTLYEKQEQKSIDLFKKIFLSIYNDRVSVIPKSNISGTVHKHSELQLIDEIALDKLYVAKDLLNILRARTFLPHESAYFIDAGGKKVYVRVQLDYEKL